ncbi:glycoside hydrolase family 3 protein [Anaerococcus sp. WCA-380-WT-2B]|uniref:beta-glucosidase n=1 Tax=Anaerococcus porci TaxID=2652269 RepID=A0A6N7VWD6_9FIRM|nr:glycoside hydrolase family 3 N-terminal domain-containing protein [Anaerococcus porci]MSS78373.1 glycoside hydrolase family 3 protein [Anaerococcus porci]
MSQPKLITKVKNIIKEEGLEFKDLNDNGRLDPYEDWRLSPEERAKDLVKRMTLEEKCGNMMIKSQKMGLSQEDKSKTSHDGILDEEVFYDQTIFIGQKNYGTTGHIKDLHLRHFILRDNFNEVEIAKWVNTINEVCESTRLGIPAIIASNSRNENAERTFGMNDAVGVFTTYPSTLGLAAIALGDKANGGDYSIFSEFGEIARDEWRYSGLRKGYMYMIDTATDPRWQRFYGTFGEDTDLISNACKRLLNSFQGEDLGKDSVALTMKHFPGGGARENGFDPHYEEGKFNVYKTKGSLEKYHLPPFKVACEEKASSIMPYYSIPSHEKSAVQYFEGKRIPFEPVGFAFNEYFIQNILRDKLGFKGYINSDSGILDNMAWGVLHLPKEERAAFAINNGVDLISDTNEVKWIIKACEEGLIKEERINEANERLLTEMFKLGLFDDKTYVDENKAKEIVENEENKKKAYRAHQKSLVLLKNSEKTLPIKSGSKVYIEYLHKELDKAEEYKKEAIEDAKGFEEISIVDNPNEADYAICFITPKSGNYFSATPGLLELSLCEDKINKSMDNTEYKETTVANIKRVKELRDIMNKNNKKLIVSVNSTMPWLLDSVEPLSDALLSHFETFIKAQLDVLVGRVEPCGKLPFTFPKSEDVIAVDENGRCISPNDVPGYDKDKYMPDGLTYAYEDSDGNIYKLGHGLRY